MAAQPTNTRAIAVYCGSSIGKQQAHVNAALSVGRALAAQNRPLVYGGGPQGLMGIVSNAVLQGGGTVTGVIPYAMQAAGGERPKTDEIHAGNTDEAGPEPSKMQTIIVDSMHERKVEMATRSAGFIGLPGGFGTFEEVLEVTTWTQLGIHNKPVVLVNVLGFYDPLRQLIQNGVKDGFIGPSNQRLIIFVDGPCHAEHENFDWGTAALQAIEKWQGDSIKTQLFDWTKRKDGSSEATVRAT
ncbi:putative possible lysine decarboxylase [Lyophyllum shimeji]|uniref:Possible lysine decarboxylase n=1 Tax=Lyophyllum shimeji TaxID=47721 RepID=A0A9P3PGQ3_LYOSH|nr:putative possible lysine decarboxylase [Lyophyllum shimeji]